MSTPWYPLADRTHYWGYYGGPMVGGPPRGVLHETLTAGIPGYSGGKTAPHITVARDGTVYQHVPFDRAARSLRNMPGNVQTNRQGSICAQIEVVAYSDKDDWTQAQITSIRALVHWLEKEWGIPVKFPLPLGGPDQYGLKNSLEMSFAQWLKFSGWAEHLHVPENTHWDAGSEAGIKAVFAPATLITMDEFYKQLEQLITSTGGNHISLWYVLEFYRELATSVGVSGMDPHGVAQELLRRGISV